jgi:hypothetical protein
MSKMGAHPWRVMRTFESLEKVIRRQEAQIDS